MNAALDFYTVVGSNRRQGELALGYRVQEDAGNPTRRPGVILNPDKSTRGTFLEGDKVSVLAEK